MYRILLVEDDAALADAITQVLTAWGHEVQKVRDFRHVTEEFAEWKPQIVLMDLMLPFLQRSSLDAGAAPHHQRANCLPFQRVG